MPTTIGWLQAFQPLPLLALNTMLQPVGRVLGSPESYRVWLRASPIICALDALALLFRFATYYASLGRTVLPRRAMLIIATDRFGEFQTSETTKIARFSRTIMFLLSLLPLIRMFGTWGEIRWTVAWSWMYIASYVILEMVLQTTMRLVRQQNADMQEDAARFEFELLAEEGDGHEIPHGGTNNMTDKASDKDEFMQGKFNTLNEVENTNGDASSITSNQSADRSNLLDPEAAKVTDGLYDDPLMAARLAYLKRCWDYGDTVLLRAGFLLQAIFVYWTFLDLIHPLLSSNILSSNGGWVTARFVISFPMILVVSFAILFLSLAFLPILYFLGCAISAILTRNSTSPWGALERVLEPVVKLLLVKYRVVGFLILGACGIICFFGMYMLWSILIIGYIAEKLWSEPMFWLYEVISVEFVIFLFFGLACVVLRLIAELVVAKSTNLINKLRISRYLEAVGVWMLTGVLATFTLSILWYRFRYPSFENGQWMDNWREYLDFNNSITPTEVHDATK